MKKKILIPVGMVALFLCASWQEAETTVSPDRLFLADNGKSLFVTNRAGCELIKMSSDGQNWTARSFRYNPEQKAELLLRIFCIIRCLNLFG